MTEVPVAEAAERLRAALADLAAGRKPKLIPADVRALLEFYDRHAEGAKASPEQPAEQPAPVGRQCPEVRDSAKDIAAALDGLVSLAEDAAVDDRLIRVLLPLASAVQGIIMREVDGMERAAVENANDAYKALAAARDGKNDAP